MNEEIRNEIVRRRQGGASLRRIAKDQGVARETVQSVIPRWEAERAGQSTSAPTTVPVRRPSLVDPFNDAILQLLERYPDITIRRVFEELRLKGFSGGLTIVRERVLELRPRPTREPVIRFETPRGAQLARLSTFRFLRWRDSARAIAPASPIRLPSRFNDSSLLKCGELARAATPRAEMAVLIGASLNLFQIALRYLTLATTLDPANTSMPASPIHVLRRSRS